MDESGCYLLPGVVRTWARCGVTPVLHAPLTRDHVSLIGAVTPEGRLLVQLLTESVDSEVIILWLEWLQKILPGKLWILWDGAPIHRSKRLRAYLAEGASQRIHLERYPGYAPELNPAEGIWQHLKNCELRNRCCADLAALKQEITVAIHRMQGNHELVKAFFKQVNYY